MKYKTQFIDFINNNRSDLADLLKPIKDALYNEFFTYTIIICIYNIFLFLLILAIFYLLLNYVLVKKKIPYFENIPNDFVDLINNIL